MDSNHKEENEKRKSDAEAVRKGTTPERANDHSAQARPADTQSVGSQSTTPAGQMGHGQLEDGYRENEGREYDQASPGPDQKNYDPTHSGARHSQRTPGATVNAPGREEGTAWAEHRQMGKTTDTERKNPAD